MRFFTFILLLAASYLSAQNVEIPDSDFQAALIAKGVDLNNDSLIQYEEALQADSLNFGSSRFTDLTGIAAFEKLRYLRFFGTAMTELDLSNNKELVTLYVSSNKLESLDVSANVKLRFLYCTNNELTSLDLSNNKLEVLDCDSNELSDLRLDGNTGLVELSCNSNELVSLDLTALVGLRELSCSHNDLSELDITSLVNLTILYCGFNPMSELNVTHNSELFRLNASGMELTSIDVSQIMKICTLNVDRNELRQLDLSHNSELKQLECSLNKLTSLDLSDKTVLEDARCNNNNLRTLTLKNCPLLTQLNCKENQLTELDLSSLPVLARLTCWENLFTEIDFTHNPMLSAISVGSNNISALDLSKVPLLRSLSCGGNNIAELDFSNNPLLSSLSCSNNKIKALDIYSLVNLYSLTAGSNQLTKLEFNPLNVLNTVNILDNPISSLDFSKIKSNRFQLFAGPGLNYLNLNNGQSDKLLDLKIDSGEFILICVDEEELADIESRHWYEDIKEFIVFSTECSDYPGDLWTFTNTLTGEVRYDASGTCDENSFKVEDFISFTVALDSTELYLNAYDEEGNIAMVLPDGEISVEPNIDNDIFKIAPSKLELSLDGNETITQDFCISPTSTEIYDISLSIIPITVPRPGFESKYRISYQNIGNVTTNGIIDLNFEALYLDFLSATVDVEQNAGLLSFAFEELAPFEKREFCATFRINSPMDTPPLNGGEVIKFKARVQSNQSQRQVPLLTCLEQEIVNSIDPNDKRCLQGHYVIDSLLGTPLAYMIRFENIGTAEAVNVRIEDSIDTTVFDLATFKVVEASHRMDTYIEDNKVSFMFSGINLPFSDELNDGYVVFELSTKEGLILNNEISNTADIFFDFNFPIATNTYISSVVTDSDEDGFHSGIDCDDDNATVYPGASEIVGNHIDEDCDGEFLSGNENVEEALPFRIYPNPAKDRVYISSEISSDFIIRLASIDGIVLMQEMNVEYFSVGEYDTGLYLLTLIEKGTQKVFNYKLIITK